MVPLLTKKNAPPFGSHVFQAKFTIFELIQDSIGTNLLSKFHEDRKINVVSRVLTSHVFQANVNIYELIQDIIETNHLTKFHEDWTINVASRELTRQMLTPHNGQRTMDDVQKTITKAHHEHLLKSGSIKRQADNAIKFGKNITSAEPSIEAIAQETKVNLYNVTADSISVAWNCVISMTEILHTDIIQFMPQNQ
ncbi:hypothetical protein DPMN_091918 [Dreissena polymorpha]|uniref:Uncharacterized protein n=1 Tax=Dreissena polymorpha TaxID=45954 RepID=A0A9D4L0E0_DREPO|nr:hypothetical protein DPMN_091918 [Dreissena polymorpha]